MAVTLSDVRMNTQDALAAQVIDEFCRQNFLLDHLVFDDAVSPMGGGATPTYTYTRVSTQPEAGTRALNTEFEPQEAKKTRFAVDLKVLGGAFEIDRVLAGMGGIVGEVQFQMNQKIKAVQALFADMVINGDSAQDPNGFDGLSKALAGTNMEVSLFDHDSQAPILDLTRSELLTQNCEAFLDELDLMLAMMDGAPTCLMGNTYMIARLRALARRASMYQTSVNSWGQTVECYGNVPLVDLGMRAGGDEPIIGMRPTNGFVLTDLYAVRMGLDGFHGVSMNSQSPINAYLPDFTTAGAVKRGEVEMVAAVALKNTRAAAVMRDIPVIDLGGGGEAVS